ncbi:hypothetical protein BHE74_00038988 [Ensete ventricosum]|nr:hypothetical protein BHE74_00038988 [Ensete ventricosum]
MVGMVETMVMVVHIGMVEKWQEEHQVMSQGEALIMIQDRYSLLHEANLFLCLVDTNCFSLPLRKLILHPQEKNPRFRESGDSDDEDDDDQKRRR